MKWDNTQDEIEDMHVLFMTNDRDRYIDKLFAKLSANDEMSMFARQTDGAGWLLSE